MLSTQEHLSKRAHIEQTSDTPSLLIVDDDPLIREGLAVAFSKDFKIYQAESRAAAIKLLRELPAPRNWRWSIWGFRPCRTVRTRAFT